MLKQTQDKAGFLLVLFVARIGTGYNKNMLETLFSIVRDIFAV